MQVRAVRRLLRQEVIYSPSNHLEMFHFSKRRQSRLTEGSDGMCPEIVESIRHPDLTSVLIFCSYRCLVCEPNARRPTASLTVIFPKSQKFCERHVLSEPAHLGRLASGSTRYGVSHGRPREFEEIDRERGHSGIPARRARARNSARSP